MANESQRGGSGNLTDDPERGERGGPQGRSVERRRQPLSGAEGQQPAPGLSPGCLLPGFRSPLLDGELRRPGLPPSAWQPLEGHEREQGQRHRQQARPELGAV